MSSDRPRTTEDLEHVSFILMRAEDTFDGQDRVMSRAAWDLQCPRHSSLRVLRPSRVRARRISEHLDGLSIETTITAAELCTAGMWERVDGGYRVLDWEAVEVCLDRVRQIRAEDPQALAWERDREAQVRAQMAKAMVVTPPCAACGIPSARIELVAPGQLARRVGAVAQHRAAQRLAATRARTVVSAVQGRRYLQRLRRPHRRQPGRADRPGVPASPLLRPGPHGRVLRRRRILPGLRRSLLLPALARVRDRLRLLPPRPRQEPGPALVAVSSPLHQTDDLLGVNEWRKVNSGQLSRSEA